LALVQSQLRQAIKDKEHLSQRIDALEAKLVQATDSVAAE